MGRIFTFTIVLALMTSVFNFAEAGFYDDNDFDGSDLAIFITELNVCSSGCNGDFVGDGDVDWVDLRTFSQNIGDTDAMPSEICGDGIDNDVDGLIDEDCIVPQTKTISIDGNPDDWEGILPIVNDDENDSYCEIGTDIKSFYLAQDSEYLYWRVDTFSGTYSFGTPGDERMLVLLFYEADAPNGPYPNGITVQLNGIDGVVLARYDNQDFIYLYGGPEYGTVGAVAEGRIPLTEFNTFKIESVHTYYYQGPDADPQCDWASKSGHLTLK